MNIKKKKITALFICGLMSSTMLFGCQTGLFPQSSSTSESVQSSSSSAQSDSSSAQSSSSSAQSSSSSLEFSSESVDFSSEIVNSSSSDSEDSSVSSDSVVHTHEFGEWKTTKYPTCQQAGLKVKECSCGEKQEEEIPIENHVYGVDGKCVWCGGEEEDSSEDSSSDSAQTNTITLSAFAGNEVDILHPLLRSFIENKEDPKAQAEALKAEANDEESLIRQNITFSWLTTGEVSSPYTLSFADNADFEKAFTEETEDTSCSFVGFFLPGVTYYWKVTSADGIESAVDTFIVKDTPARVITAGSMHNVRDMGGWKVGENQRVAYGKFYRGDDPSFAVHGNEAAWKVLRHLGINGEIDVRFDTAATQNFLGADKPFLNAGLKYFSQNLPNTVPGTWAETNGDIQKPLTEVSANIGKIFKFLANENNYPVYLHCTWGKDRTGSICYLIGGLLGMSYEDLMCDYELSSFGAGIKTQPRNEIEADPNGGWKFRDAKDDPWGHAGRMHYDIAQNYPAASTSESIAKYLMQECGVTETEITNVKKNLLEQI